MDEYWSNLKPAPAECGCGCGIVGALRTKAHRDGTVCVKRGCPCRRCLGKRSRSKGDDKARRARKALAIPGANTRHEEHWGGLVRTEMKAGAQVKPAVTAFLRMEVQSEEQRPIGDNRPFVGVAMPDGSKDGIVMFRLSKMPDVIAALAEQLGQTA